MPSIHYLYTFFQLELSWFGSDAESGIHLYEVGLSSTGSEDVDLLPYSSTHGHRHFITYHPDLMDGETFYIHINAVNRAGKHTVQVRGCLYYLTWSHQGSQQDVATSCPSKGGAYIISPGHIKAVNRTGQQTV